jgi:hypothetical protein
MPRRRTSIYFEEIVFTQTFEPGSLFTVSLVQLINAGYLARVPSYMVVGPDGEHA